MDGKEEVGGSAVHRTPVALVPGRKSDLMSPFVLRLSGGDSSSPFVRPQDTASHISDTPYHLRPFHSPFHPGNCNSEEINRLDAPCFFPGRLIYSSRRCREKKNIRRTFDRLERNRNALRGRSFPKFSSRVFDWPPTNFAKRHGTPTQFSIENTNEASC